MANSQDIVVDNISIFIQDSIHCTILTRPTYGYIFQSIKKKDGINSILDVGVATGQPLLSIVDKLKNQISILGIDINNSYLRSSKRLFQNYQNVQIKQLNFYSLSSLKRKYSVIIFGSSFMLMPDRLKALQIVKQNLQQKGTVYFLQTLYREKTYFNRIIQLLKPYLKYITTVDFGEVTYRKDFQQLLDSRGFEIKKIMRAQGNFMLSLFNFMMVEVASKE